MEELQKLIARLVQNIEDENQLDERIVSFRDYKSKYVNLKPLVNVNIELTNGRTLTIDVTDYFEGVVK